MNLILKFNFAHPLANPIMIYPTQSSNNHQIILRKNMGKKTVLLIF